MSKTIIKLSDDEIKKLDDEQLEMLRTSYFSEYRKLTREKDRRKQKEC